MRFASPSAACALTCACCFLIASFPQTATTVVAKDDKKIKSIYVARQTCYAWLEDNTANGKLSPKEMLGSRKITEKKQIADDFAEMEKEITPDHLAKFLPPNKDDKFAPAAPDPDLFVAIWHRWRILEKDLKDILSDLDNFSKVRFESEPKGAKISVDSLPRGETPKTLYMSRSGKFQLLMSKDGYESWSKSDYTPRERSETHNETFRKKP